MLEELKAMLLDFFIYSVIGLTAVVLAVLTVMAITNILGGFVCQ